MRTPAGPVPRRDGPEPAVARLAPRSTSGPFPYRQLLAQNQVLEDQIPSPPAEHSQPDQKQSPIEPHRRPSARRLSGGRNSHKADRVLKHHGAAGLLARPASAPPWASEPRRHDHHRPPRRAVGNRRHRLPHHPRGQRHGLHRRRPLHAGVRRHPRGSPRYALRGARAAPPGAAGAPRRLRAGRRRRAQPAHDHGSQYLSDHF